jgi:hypothetical protein
MLMVITSFPRWLKTQQVRLNTLVKFEPAEPLFGGQFSSGGNNNRDECECWKGLKSVPVDPGIYAASRHVYTD